MHIDIGERGERRHTSYTIQREREKTCIKYTIQREIERIYICIIYTYIEREDIHHIQHRERERRGRDIDRRGKGHTERDTEGGER